MGDDDKVSVTLSRKAHAALTFLMQEEYNMHLTPGDDAAMDEIAVALGLNLDSL